MDNKKSVVLVVENNETIAKLIQRHLEKANYSVVVANNGLEAIKILEKSNSNDLPCCITMAIMMPVMDGFEACERIKKDKLFKDIPVIILTAQADIQNQIKAVEYGADDFLGKPVEKILLLKKVGNCAKLTQTRRESIRLAKELSAHNSIHSILKTRKGGDSEIGVDDSEY